MGHLGTTAEGIGPVGDGGGAAHKFLKELIGQEIIADQCLRANQVAVADHIAGVGGLDHTICIKLLDFCIIMRMITQIIFYHIGSLDLELVAGVAFSDF